MDHLSFTVEPGRVRGFLGPNGAGKSTTMRLILGLDRPQADVAHINAYLPEQAGTLITHTHEQSGDLPSPWRGSGALHLDGAGPGGGRLPARTPRRLNLAEQPIRVVHRPAADQRQRGLL